MLGKSIQCPRCPASQDSLCRAPHPPNYPLKWFVPTAASVAEPHCTGWAPGPSRAASGECLPESSIRSFIVDTWSVTVGLDRRLHTGGKRTSGLARVTHSMPHYELWGPCSQERFTWPSFQLGKDPDPLGDTEVHPFTSLPRDTVMVGRVPVLCWSCPLGWSLPGGSVTLLTPLVSPL